MMDRQRSETGVLVPGHVHGKAGSVAHAPTAPVRPRELPPIREHLLKLWRPGGLFEQVVSIAEPPACAAGPFNPAAYSRWERQALDGAELLWVAEPMCDLLQAAAASVPDDLRVDDLEPPYGSGFAVLEKPYVGTSSDTGKPIIVSAFVWSRSELPPPFGHAWSLASYEALDDPLTLLSGTYSVGGRLWVMLGRSDWPVKDELVAPPWDMTPEALQSFVEDRRILAALWTLIGQQGLSLSIEERHARTQRRQMERDGISLDRQMVRVVTLREAHAGVSPDASDDVRREYTHSWIVQGHWRNQPFGPGRAQRRLQWIAPYTKGSGELLTPTVVNAWRR